MANHLYRVAIKMDLYGKMKSRSETQLGKLAQFTGESTINIISRVYGETGESVTLVFPCIGLFSFEEIKKSLKVPLGFISSGTEVYCLNIIECGYKLYLKGCYRKLTVSKFG